ncbi:hypothetical protein [Streptomyces sp. MP131-18]|uniref:hypothetical protein n=1 Tax=Streptomyces sp. MP131-18 TaxID=1857892 RepID=UPI00097C5B28|nr:hypothetical protein [Streptomyces sp. MP131-18]ONK09461.1 hypothetical protein STBA_01610 [Streptomyces sp. MP131-18]
MTTTIDHVNGTGSDVDLVAAARAEAIRREAETRAETDLIAARAAADAERARAEADAEATRIKAQEEAEKQRLANETVELRQRRTRAEQEAKIAKAEAEREATMRAAAQARRADEAEQQQAEQEHKSVAEADAKWRKYAKRFAILCGIVALPVQLAAFWNEDAPWLVAAPVMLELGAWVVHRGAAAAVANGRPAWHYRTIVWLLALVAAAVNLSHGLHAFDPATAWATAFASIAGPGVWDLHEHGRIAKRDGRETRRQRKQREKNEGKRRAEESERAAKQEADKKAAQEAAEQAAKVLAEQRAQLYPDVWKHAVKLAAALGETTVTDAIWNKAHENIEGAPPGEDVETIRMRNQAAHRVEAARTGTPVNRVATAVSSQVASQMPRPKRPGPKQRATRRPGDSPKHSRGARNQASITAKKAIEKSGVDQ